jgi:hypothetical protein
MLLWFNFENDFFITAGFSITVGFFRLGTALALLTYCLRARSSLLFSILLLWYSLLVALFAAPPMPPSLIPPFWLLAAASPGILDRAWPVALAPVDWPPLWLKGTHLSRSDIALPLADLAGGAISSFCSCFLERSARSVAHPEPPTTDDLASKTFFFVTPPPLCGPLVEFLDALNDMCSFVRSCTPLK